ncbi:hypothetical protein GLOIN_2v1792160 [Rhizophagus clarus]|uniref:Uncharacterized protein n=1 Tax=Rhizophagus clarus TaxID=94130 RepID=A0A8H3KS08_9GLOM|nr:hypothetical protein GLOIN_2v1792160 [Rhizophagus clarus]
MKVLRYLNPTGTTTMLQEIDQTDQRMSTLVKDVGGWYSTYRYKFHVSVVKLANEFTILHKDEADYDKLLEEFMTEDVWKQLLQMHLKATNRLKLKKNGIITAKLSLFVCQIV